MATGRVIAVGDIHGCSAALAALVGVIRPQPDDTLVPLGDFIDRGPDSRGVMEQLIQLSRECILLPLLGNHEEMFFAAREGASELQFWLRFGGQATLTSYGINGPRQVPERHVRFLKRCDDYHETASHFFVHGYYVAGSPLTAQLPGVLRWTQLPTHPEPHCSGKVAVVGHTPQLSGEILDLGFLKCIDTFCHGGGWLTALDVTTGQVWQADRDGKVRG